MRKLIVIMAGFALGFVLAGACCGQTVSVVAETGEFVAVPTAARVTTAEANVDALEAGFVAASISATSAATNLTNTVTVTVQDAAGATIAGIRSVKLWTSATAGGAASTNNIESVTATTGTILASNGAWRDVVTGTNGTFVAAVVGTAAGTNYVNAVAGDGKVKSAALVFTGE
jgi:hypothetical protein